MRGRTVRDGEGRATRVPGDPKHDTAAGLGDLELIAALDRMAAASNTPSPGQTKPFVAQALNQKLASWQAPSLEKIDRTLTS